MHAQRILTGDTRSKSVAEHLFLQNIGWQLQYIDHRTVLGSPAGKHVYERPCVAGPLLRAGPVAMFPRLQAHMPHQNTWQLMTRTVLHSVVQADL